MKKMTIENLLKIEEKQLFVYFDSIYIKQNKQEKNLFKNISINLIDNLSTIKIDNNEEVYVLELNDFEKIMIPIAEVYDDLLKKEFSPFYKNADGEIIQ